MYTVLRGVPSTGAMTKLNVCRTASSSVSDPILRRQVLLVLVVKKGGKNSIQLMHCMGLPFIPALTITAHVQNSGLLGAKIVHAQVAGLFAANTRC